MAHRLSTIVNSDKIAVISDGGIAEEGTHRELLALDGIYTSLCESQGITKDSTFEENTPGEPIGGVKYSVRQSMMKSMIKSLATKEGGMIEEEDVEAGDVPEESDETDPEEEKLASKSRLWELR